jgi:hypothetical protein
MNKSHTNIDPHTHSPLVLLKINKLGALDGSMEKHLEWSSQEEPP